MDEYESSPSVKSEEAASDSATSGATGPPKKRKKKVEIACVYCRRSHMICDDSRPCQRCIKRGIGHLCYDEPSNTQQKKKVTAYERSLPELRLGKDTPIDNSKYPQLELRQETAQVPGQPRQLASEFPGQNHGRVEGQQYQNQTLQNAPIAPHQQDSTRQQNSVLAQTIPYNQEPLFYSEHAGSEFSSLNDFLSMIDDPELVNGALMDSNNVVDFGLGTNPGLVEIPESNNISNVMAYSPSANPQFPTFMEDTKTPQRKPSVSQATGNGHQPVISDSARDKFFLTAADPTTEISPEERLKQVIKAKLEAGLLQPYNYAKGYARLQGYMDNYMNASSRQRILKPLSIFRPAFRAIARTLKDVDLVLVEESFERMLLDYDRVFTSMAIPACLWRRTGEIYRGNKEFASLVGVKADDLKDGKLAIYELMSEESAVNFWEKYGAIAFDKGQKAVLTSCNLRTRDGTKRKSCCFSFTIRRDRYNIPSCIVGNFIPIDP